MEWEKPSKELGDLLQKALASYECQKKTMFGSPTYFKNGNMFAGVHQKSLLIRLSESDQRELFASNREARTFEPMEGRPMKEYVVLPRSIYKDGRIFAQWLGRSYKYVSSLPEKKAKRKERKKT